MDMIVKEFLKEMKSIQTILLDFLDDEENAERKFQDLLDIFDKIKIHDNQSKIKSFFYLMLKISNNHHRESGFFSKIDKILNLFKDDMKKYFSKNELFHIFKSNKRLLLFLLEENMIFMDEFIVKKIIKNVKYIDQKYPQYFQPEIQPFINQKWFPKYNKNLNEWVEEIQKELPDDFYVKRKIGENDNEICKLIQKDLIEEFIIYINKNCYPIKSTINPSIYETNKSLLKIDFITLIGYAVFHGSIKIFNYLKQNGAELESSLWFYAVHSQNPEIINFLEENKIFPSRNDISFEILFYESIKCHHISVTNYIKDNYLHNINEYSNKTLIYSLKYYNFMFMQFNIEYKTSFNYLCKYDYCLLVFELLKKIGLDINCESINIIIHIIISFNTI